MFTGKFTKFVASRDRLILVLPFKPGGSALTGSPPVFDEIARGKVSFPPQLSVK
jgi:hypothetical protein